jgi:hypothetical protein
VDVAETAAELGQRIGDFDRRAGSHRALDQSARLELLEPGREHAVSHGVEPLADLAEAQGPRLLEQCHEQAVPGPCEDVHRGLEQGAELAGVTLLHDGFGLSHAGGEYGESRRRRKATPLP